MSSGKLQNWSQAPAPSYGYPSQPPQAYYNYPPQAPPPNQQYQQYQPYPPPQGYQSNQYQFDSPPQQLPNGYYPPPQQPQYYQPPPQQYQSQAAAASYATPNNAQSQASEETSFSFVRSEHKGWHVFDSQGALVFDVIYKKASMFHQSGCEVHLGQGGPVLATIYDESLTMGSQTSKIKRNSKHSNKLSFTDASGREFSYRETGQIDYLLSYPSKENVMRGSVDIGSGRGSITILDPANVPDAAVLVASYVELLRKQSNDSDVRNGGVMGSIGAASF